MLVSTKGKYKVYTWSNQYKC